MKTTLKTMKIHSCFVGSLLLLLGACTPKDSFRLTGELEGVADGTVISLEPTATHKQEKVMGETVLKDGKFVLEGKLAEPRLLSLKVEGKQIYYPLMIENGRITLQGKVKQTINGGQEVSSLEDVVITGSKADQEFREKTAFRKKFDEDYQQLHQKYEGISRKLNEARKSGNAVLIDSLNQTEEMRSYGKDERAFFDHVEKQTMAAIQNNKDSYWGPLLMLYCINYYNGEPEFIALYNSFSEEVQKSYYGQLLKKELMPENLIGKPLPVFSAPDQKGEMRTDSELRRDKKCVLIDFWASWCGPCRKEIPNLKKIYAAYASKGLEIISISIDKDEKAWQKALEEEQLPWPNLIDQQNLFGDQFFGRAVPAIFLVTDDGIVKYDKLRGQALADKVAELLN